MNSFASTVDKATLHRAIAASAIGNATEWFDYGIYAYGVTYISAALFPGEVGEAVLFALATFAISFLVRPLGGVFWGSLGDRLGRAISADEIPAAIEALVECYKRLRSGDERFLDTCRRIGIEPFQEAVYGVGAAPRREVA